MREITLDRTMPMWHEHIRHTYNLLKPNMTLAEYKHRCRCQCYTIKVEDNAKQLELFTNDTD